jgi:ATP:corrinoid adenosyltransferase
MKKFTFQMNEEEREALHRDNDALLEQILAMAADYDMLVLDESVYAMSMGLLTEGKILDFLKTRPAGLEVVLTGRNPSQALIDAADYVSEIGKVKHPYDQGLSSRVGIEK